MEKRFTTKIFVLLPVKGSKPRSFSERLIDVHLLPSCEGDDCTLDDVTKYWSDRVVRRSEYPLGLYRVETSLTRCRQKCACYLQKVLAK